MDPNEQQFLEVVQRTPLVSIDVVLRDTQGRILLGLRNRNPAKDTWFVPGGRIKKTDSGLDAAFGRITEHELGTRYSRAQARFLGVFDNRYDTNFADAPGIGTYYVVLVYEIAVSQHPLALPTTQHREWRWFGESDALATPQVNDYVRPYFRRQPPG